LKIIIILFNFLTQNTMSYDIKMEE